MSWGEHSNDSLLPLAPCFGWAGAVAGAWEHQLCGSTRAIHAKTWTAVRVAEQGRCLDINCRGWPGPQGWRYNTGLTGPPCPLPWWLEAGWDMPGTQEGIYMWKRASFLKVPLELVCLEVMGERADPHRECTCWFSLMYSPLKPLNGLWFPLLF